MQNEYLLKKLFECETLNNDKNFSTLLNKTLFLNYEFFKIFVEKQLNKNEKLTEEILITKDENFNLKSQLSKLEIVN